MLHPKITRLSLFSVLPAIICLFAFTFVFINQTETGHANTQAPSQHASSTLSSTVSPALYPTQSESDALSDVVQVSVGFYHACALKENGEVFCWGGNQWGQLGTGDRLPSTVAVQAVGLPQNIVAVEAGEDHTCALTGSGNVHCWGSGYIGQLGDGMVSNGFTPSDVGTFSGDVVSLAVGGAHSCGLTSDGDMKCWGGNSFGELGTGTDALSQTLPVDIATLSGTVQAIGVGSNHTCALTTSGGVKCWGQNSFGEVGNGTNDNQRTPQDVVDLTTGAVDVIADGFRTCAIMETGNAKCWGHGGFGALGDGRGGHSSTPVNVVNLSSTVRAISAGTVFTCALLESGGVECWGGNSDGQLGDGTTTASATPVGVTGLAGDVTDISSNSAQSCAVINRGVQCWGTNPFNDQSNEPFLNSTVPVDVLVPDEDAPPNPSPDFSCSTVTEIPQAECDALVSFYNSLDGPNWNDNSDWFQTDNPCEWFGVGCSNNSVNRLDLRGNGLSGQLPTAIVELGNLEHLSLSSNQISGTLPADLPTLTELQTVSLNSNQLTGSIPDGWSSSNRLRVLSLDENLLEGEIPATLGLLANLEILNLGQNLLSGSIPVEITNLLKLESLKLYNNGLTGIIPNDIGTLQALEIFRVEENFLEGALPPSMGNLAQLTYLSLPDNDFSGAIPVEIGNLAQLTYLDLQNNQLTGSIPSSLGSLTIIEQLTLNRNALEGEIPASLRNLTELTKLYLQDNSLTGAVPVGFGDLVNIVDLRFNNNELSGPLPSDLVGLTQLEAFHFRATELCEPADATFQQWINSIEDVTTTNERCSDDSTPPTPEDPDVAFIGSNSGAPGSTFVIKGSNFPTNTEVTIQLDTDLIEPAQTIVVTTNDSGEFWLVLITNTEADAGGYTVTIADAGSIGITLDTDAEVNTSDAPSDQEASTVRIEVPSTQARLVMLPYVANLAPPVVAPTLAWEPMGDGPRLVRELNINNGILSVAERSGDGAEGGLYQKPISGCNTTTGFNRIPAVDSQLLSLDFSGTQGVAAAFSDGIYYQNGSGWNRVEKDTLDNDLGLVYSVSFVGNTIYAGANDQQGNVETQGKVYESADGGATWNHLIDTPAVMNVIQPFSVNLWLGTDGAGIQLWTFGGDSLVAFNSGLTGEALKVWDMVILPDARFYIATNGGVYQRSGINGDWTVLGEALRGVAARSLAVVGDELYAGTLSNGVHRISLAEPDNWTPITNGSDGSGSWEVRDLLYDDTHCNGLLAGTKDGVWVLR